jgi:hypothetical protein
MITEFAEETTVRLSTPTLVRKYKDLHVTGARRRLTDREADQMTAVVNELRHRNVLN